MKYFGKTWDVGVTSSVYVSERVKVLLSSKNLLWPTQDVQQVWWQNHLPEMFCSIRSFSWTLTEWGEIHLNSKALNCLKQQTDLRSACLCPVVNQWVHFYMMEIQESTSWSTLAKCLYRSTCYQSARGGFGGVLVLVQGSESSPWGVKVTLQEFQELKHVSVHPKKVHKPDVVQRPSWAVRITSQQHVQLTSDLLPTYTMVQMPSYSLRDLGICGYKPSFWGENTEISSFCV